MFSVTVSACLKFICTRCQKFGNFLILFTESQTNKLIIHLKKAYGLIQRKVL